MVADTAKVAISD